MRDIGKNIRELRLKKNMTQDALAESLFVTRQTVSNYETGKSRPDVDMLVQMADVLGTDMNTLLYGPAKDENRKRELRGFGIGLCASIVTGMPVLFKLAIEKALRNPAYGMGVLRFFVWPLFLVIFGWTLMQGIALLTNSRPLKAKWSRCVYWTVLTAVLFYFVLQLPECIHEIRGHFVGLYIDTLVPPKGWSSSFRYNPKWLSFLSGKLFRISLYNKWTFFAAGILLWLFKGGRNKKHSLYALGVALLVSLGIYFMADSEFVLSVENPEELSNVPYGIKVEQWVEQ